MEIFLKCILMDINSIPKIAMVVGNYFAVGIISIYFAKHISFNYSDFNDLTGFDQAAFKA
jgi:hypothetical protein